MYEGQGQVIIYHSVCGMYLLVPALYTCETSLLVPALDTYFWHNAPPSWQAETQFHTGHKQYGLGLNIFF